MAFLKVRMPEEGTSLTILIYGSVVFDLTFFNEVTSANETLFSLRAKVIDSSRPYLSQSVTPTLQWES